MINITDDFSVYFLNYVKYIQTNFKLSLTSVIKKSLNYKMFIKIRDEYTELDSALAVLTHPANSADLKRRRPVEIGFLKSDRYSLRSI